MKEIRRQTCRKYTFEEKVRIVLEGLKGVVSIVELCRREGVVSNLYYRWSKDFLEVGRKRLAGDSVRGASSSEVGSLRPENDQLKLVVSELSLKNRLLKKSLTGLEWGVGDICTGPIREDGDCSGDRCSMKSSCGLAACNQSPLS